MDANPPSEPPPPPQAQNEAQGESTGHPQSSQQRRRQEGGRIRQQQGHQHPQHLHQSRSPPVSPPRSDQQGQQHQPQNPVPPPISSPVALDPSTPQPVESAADDYFERVTPAPPPPSHLYSTASHGDRRHAPSPTPTTTTTTTTTRRSRRPRPSRQPSIRIRLSNHSNPSIYTLSTAPLSQGPTSSQDAVPPCATVVGRSRSGSQSSAASIASAPADYSSAARLAPHTDAAGPARNSRRMGVQTSLPRLTEEGSRPTMAELGLADASSRPPSIVQTDGGAEELNRAETPRPGMQDRLRKASRFFWPGRNRRGSNEPESVASAESRHEAEYHEELVDWLDIIDPEVQTLSTLTNVQNSLFVPNLGTWVNRRPTYVLSQHDLSARRPATAEGRTADQQPQNQQQQPPPPPPPSEAADPGLSEDQPEHPPPMQRSSTITSRLSDTHYASLPHGKTLQGWSAADKRELDDRVRHMLHSRRAKFKRTMKGFGQYVRRPLGFFVTLYATLITIFGLAWVLFLIGWIEVGSKQRYVIHIIDSVLVALFAIMGDGLIPFRIVDTYHMIYILHCSRIMKKAGKMPRARLRKLRSSRGEEPLVAANDSKAAEAAAASPTPEALRPQLSTIAEMPSQPGQQSDTGETGAVQEPPAVAGGGAAGGDRYDDDAANDDVESGKSDDEPHGYHPLSSKQVKSLLHHQTKLAKSHSFYKPQETETHFCFPLNYLVAVILLLDFHSCLQVSLGACTWGYNYHYRPFALTTVILCCSITCNLSAGLVITIGDRKTRKKDVVELLDRQELTSDAIARMEHKKEKEEEERKEAILERMAASQGR